MYRDFHYLDTSKFEKLREKPSEFLVEILALAQQRGLRLAIKQIKCANIAVSRNKEKRYDKLLVDCITLLQNKFPYQYKYIDRFKNEAFLLQNLYGSIFKQVPDIKNKNDLAKEKLGFLIYIENYLLLNGLLYLSQMNSEINDVKLQVEQLINHGHFLDEQGRELRNILLYFHGLDTSEMTPIFLLPEEIMAQEKYLILINEFWFFSHIYEMWAYLDMELYASNKILTCKLPKMHIFRSWMVANYRSRSDREAKNLYFRAKKSTALLDGNKMDLYHYMCQEYFFAGHDKIKVCHILISEWLLAYKHIIEYANKSLHKKFVQPAQSCLTDRFEKKPQSEWIKIISNNKISQRKAFYIFSRWVLNDRAKKNKGDIFDHFFYKIEGEYILFNTIASMVDPIQCLLSLSKEKEMLGGKRNPFEKEVGQELTQHKIPHVSQLFFKEKEYSLFNTDNFGEFDFVFELNNTIFFIECKCITQPFYFRDYHIMYEKIAAGCEQLQKSANHITLNHFQFNRGTPLMREIFSYEWWKTKKIEKIVLTSSKLGAPLRIKGCMVLDRGSFYRWLQNKPIVLRNMNTLEATQVIFKGKETLFERFEDLKNNVPEVDFMRARCKWIQRKEKIAHLEVTFPFIECLPDMVFEDEVKNSKGHPKNDK